MDLHDNNETRDSGRASMATALGILLVSSLALVGVIAGLMGQWFPEGPPGVSASAQAPVVAVEDVILPAGVATPDVEPTEVPEMPPETSTNPPQTPEEPTTVPEDPQAAPEPPEADSYTPDCPAILAGPDDGSDLWLDCYSWAVETAETPEEDDPRWDCRTMGNRTCGVQIGDAWYVVTFDDAGKPLTITERGW